MNPKGDQSKILRKTRWLTPLPWIAVSLLFHSQCADPEYLEPPPTSPSTAQSTGDAGSATPATTTPTATEPATTAPETPAAPAPPPPPPPSVDPKVACNSSGKFYDDISGGAIVCTSMDALKPDECSDNGLSTYFTSRLNGASQTDLTSKKSADAFELATHDFDQCLICPANSTFIPCERQNPSAPQTSPMLKVFMANKANPTEGFWVELLYEVVP